MSKLDVMRSGIGVRVVLKDGRIVFLNNTSATEVNFLIRNCEDDPEMQPLQASENDNDFLVFIREINYILED